MLVQQKSHHPGWDSGILCAYIGGGTGQGRTAIFVALSDGGAAILLRCPAVTSLDGASSCPADRGHSLGFLSPPPAAVASLPRFSLASPVQI